MRYAFFCLLSLTLACPEQVVIREVEASCGDGEVQAGEACDDGNDVDTDACTASCRVAQCGDGITRGDLGPEERVVMMAMITPPMVATTVAPPLAVMG